MEEVEEVEEKEKEGGSRRACLRWLLRVETAAISLAKLATPQEAMEEEATMEAVLIPLEVGQQTTRLVVTWETTWTTLRTTWRRIRQIRWPL